MNDRLADGRDALVRPGPKLRPGSKMPFRSALMTVSMTAWLIALGITSKASDRDLQRALLEAGCVKADIRALPGKDKTSIYRANCLGSSHKILGIVCVGGRCAVAIPSTERNDSNQPE